MKLFLKIAMAAATLAMVCGCGSPRYGAATTGEIPVSEVGLYDGKMSFQQHCHQCHPSGEAGIGPALNDKPLPRWLMRLQVRKGLGEMPAFSEAELADPQLDNLLAYVEALSEVAGSTDAAK